MKEVWTLLYRGNQQKQHNAKKKTDNRTVEINMDDKLYIQTYVIISEIKLNCLSTKRHDYGTTQLFQVLDEKQLEYIFKLAEESIKVPVWKYSENVI